MWTIITAISIVAVIIITGMRVVSRNPAPPDPQEQPVVVDPNEADFPDPGSDAIARRPDGTPVPGSEEDRRRHGQL